MGQNNNNNIRIIMWDNYSLLAIETNYNRLFFIKNGPLNLFRFCIHLSTNLFEICDRWHVKGSLGELNNMLLAGDVRVMFADASILYIACLYFWYIGFSFTLSVSSHTHSKHRAPLRSCLSFHSAFSYCTLWSRSILRKMQNQVLNMLCEVSPV